MTAILLSLSLPPSVQATLVGMMINLVVGQMTEKEYKAKGDKQLLLQKHFSLSLYPPTLTLCSICLSLSHSLHVSQLYFWYYFAVCCDVQRLSV